MATTTLSKDEDKPNIPLLVSGIMCYSIISVSIVYFNYWFFTRGFKFPVFISWFQQIVGTIIFASLAKVAQTWTTIAPCFPTYKLESGIAKKLSPLAITFVLCIATSNLCLKYCLVSTYLVAKSCTLLFVLALSYIVLRKTENLWVITSCFTMAAGLVVNSLDPSTLSFLGLMYGCTSSVFQALYNVNIKKYMPLVNNDSQTLLFYNMALSSVLYLPVVLGFEGLAPFKEAFSTNSNLYIIWGGILINGILSTSMNMFQYLVMRITNPVATNIVGIAKSIVQTMGGFVFFNDALTSNSLAGISLTLLGSIMYCTSKNVDYIRASRKERELAGGALRKSEQAV